MGAELLSVSCQPTLDPVFPRAVSSTCRLLLSAFLYVLVFYPKNGGGIFL
jgi:hypothetical protein